MCLIYFATKREYDIPLFVDAENSTAVELESHDSHGFSFQYEKSTNCHLLPREAVRKPHQ